MQVEVGQYCHRTAFKWHQNRTVQAVKGVMQSFCSVLTKQGGHIETPASNRTQKLLLV